jgi:hypothetical protein
MDRSTLFALIVVSGSILLIIPAERAPLRPSVNPIIPVSEINFSAGDYEIISCAEIASDKTGFRRCRAAVRMPDGAIHEVVFTAREELIRESVRDSITSLLW